MHTKAQKLEAFSRLLDIMDELREKCPWDRKQTMESLRHLTIEETYELSDAILEGNKNEIKKELGDVLLHIVFYARIASESNQFDIAHVIHSLCDKLVIRHPHIYGDVKAETEEQVKENWEQIKLKEGNKSVLSGVSKGTPALVKAYRMQEKAAQVGFDWETADQVWNKVSEEMEEFKAELASGNQEKAQKEFGDLLFALVNLARKSGLNPDDGLEATNRKFRNRFMLMEEQIVSKGHNMTDYTLEALDTLWNEAKKDFPE